MNGAVKWGRVTSLTPWPGPRRGGGGGGGCRYLQLDDEVNVFNVLVRVHQLHNVGVAESAKVPRVMVTHTASSSTHGDSHCILMTHHTYS